MSKAFSVSLILLCALLVSVSAAAQDVCPSTDTLPALVEACATSAAGSACAADGTITPLDQPISDDQPRLIRLSGSGGEIVVTLLGVTLSAYEQGEMAGVGPIEIGNAAGYNVNMRGGPGSNFDVVGIFRFDARLLADGQSADGAWLRVTLDDGSFAWVSKSLVSNNPDLAALPVVDQNAAALTVGHVLTLTRTDSSCAGVTGAFISATGNSAQRLTLNDAPISLTDGTLFVALDDAGMTFYGLSGDGNIGVGAAGETLEGGGVVTWDDAPTLPDAIPPFPALDLLDALALEPSVCLAAVDAPADALDEIDGDTVVGTLESGVSYLIDAQGADGWLRLAGDGGWISGDGVMTRGACDSLPAGDVVQPAAPVVGAGLTPDQVMYRYLNARLVADGAQMQSLSCAAWDAQALLQSQSFRAMRAELLNVACFTASQSGANAVVRCDGVIQTEYNGELRQWELGSYAMTQESGAWRVCGETR